LFAKPEEAEDEYTVEEEVNGEKSVTNKMQGWTWYGLYFKLSGGDLLKFEQVGKLNFIGALNFLAYQRTQENYINAKAQANGNNY
jgi:hypothetical protein